MSWLKMATLLASNSFYKQEALDTINTQDYYDPASIVVNLVSDEGVIAKPLITRLSVGRYVASIDSDLLVDKKHYELLWLYDLYPDCPQISRQQFIYNATPADIAGLCRVYGTYKPFGIPEYGIKVVISTTDGPSKLKILANDYTITDSFGQWSFFIEQDAYAIIRIGNSFKYVKIPEQGSVSYDDLPSTESVIPTDKFGNPI